MKEVRIVGLDKRGRIVIPQIIRKSIGLETNSQIMIIADSDSKTIKIQPIGLSGMSKPMEYKITMTDSPGALGKIATAFGELGISLVYGEAISLVKDELAVWTVIGPAPESTSLEELKEALKEKGDAKKVEIKPLE